MPPNITNTNMIDIHVRNEELYSRMLDLVQAVLAILAKRINTDLVVIDESQWVKSDNNTYHKQYIRKPLWSAVTHKARDEIQSLNEYEKCLEVLENDPVISPQLNTLVGTRFGSHRIEADYIILGPIYAFLEDDAIKGFELSIFNNEYIKIEEALYSDEIEFSNITPLCGFQMEQELLRVTDNISLVKLTDKEVLTFFRLGLKLGDSLGNEDFVHGIHEFAIKITYRLPKVIGDADRSIDEIKSNKYFTNHYEKETVNSLRVFKEGKFYPISSIRKSNSIFSPGISFSLEKPVKPFMSGEYIFSASDSDPFTELYSSITEAKLSDNHFMAVNIRRFSQSCDRADIEDRIIDLMISAEALFLSSGGSFQGELKYRLAHRAAMLIGDDIGDRKYVFEFMQKAYDVRSSIVHGSTPKLPKKMDGNEYTLEEFCSDIEMYLRVSTKKAISLVSDTSGSRKEIDWKSIVFPE